MTWIPEAREQGLGLQSTGLKELSGRDPREYNLPAVACVLLAALLVSVGWHIGFSRPSFWMLAVSAGGLVALLERRLRRFVDAWGDEEGLVLTNGKTFEKVRWQDVQSVENHFSSVCTIRFGRDTKFGRTLKFSLPTTPHLVGFEHPNAVWMREQVSRARPDTKIG
jgi:hypothetical protein